MDAMFRRRSVTLHLFLSNTTAALSSEAARGRLHPDRSMKSASPLGDAVVSDAAHVAAAACFSSWQSSPNPGARPRGRFKMGECAKRARSHAADRSAKTRLPLDRGCVATHLGDSTKFHRTA